MAFTNRISGNITTSTKTTSINDANNLDSINTLITTITSSVVPELKLYKIAANGERTDTIYRNDLLKTAITSLSFTGTQNNIILAVKLFYDKTDLYDIFSLLTNNIFKLNIVNVDSTASISAGRRLPINNTKTDVISSYSLLDSISFLLIVGKLTSTDPGISKLVSDLVDNIYGNTLKLREGVFGYIDYNVQNTIIAYNSIFTDTINGNFAPGLSITTAIKNKLGVVTRIATSHTTAGDGTLGVGIDSATDGYLTLDKLMLIEYVFDINTSYSLSTLYTYNTFLQRKFSTIAPITITIPITVSDTGIVA